MVMNFYIINLYKNDLPGVWFEMDAFGCRSLVLVIILNEKDTVLLNYLLVYAQLYLMNSLRMWYDIYAV